MTTKKSIKPTAKKSGSAASAAKPPHEKTGGETPETALKAEHHGKPQTHKKVESQARDAASGKSARASKGEKAAKTEKSVKIENAPAPRKSEHAAGGEQATKTEQVAKSGHVKKSDSAAKPDSASKAESLTKADAPPKPERAAPAAAVAVSPPKPKLAKDELRQFKTALLELRDKLTRQIGAMEGEALKEGSSEVSVDHMADHGTETFDQDFTLGLIENEENTIREIDDALVRMNEGTYGLCEPCIEVMAKYCKTCPQIPKARLEAIPYTRYCVEYARVAERNREIEEAQDEEEE